MADNIERIDRRKFLGLAGRTALFGGAVSLLHIQTAHAEQVVNCPIYLFHSGSTAPVQKVINDSFKEGRMPVTVGGLTRIIMGEDELPDQPLFALSFDDGYIAQYEQAAPILDKYGIPATFFVMGTAWNGDGVHTYMRPRDLQDLYLRGHEIGSHTVTHRNLVNLSATNSGECDNEVNQSKDQLQEVINDEVPSFCFPNGAYNQKVIQRVIDAGYTSGSTELPSRIQSGDYYNRYLLKRTRIN